MSSQAKTLDMKINRSLWAENVTCRCWLAVARVVKAAVGVFQTAQYLIIVLLFVTISGGRNVVGASMSALVTTVCMSI